MKKTLKVPQRRCVVDGTKLKNKLVAYDYGVKDLREALEKVIQMLTATYVEEFAGALATFTVQAACLSGRSCVVFQMRRVKPIVGLDEYFRFFSICSGCACTIDFVHEK
jgi:hypothetical protein